MNNWVYLWDTETPFGWALLAGGPNGARRFDFGFKSKRLAVASLQKHEKPESSANNVKDAKWLPSAVRDINNYFGGQNPRFNIPLDMAAHTEFQKRIWRACAKIPSGQTRTYGELAASARARAAARAAGNALNANPFPVIIPCHRVIRSNGGLGGFGKGIAMKTSLLQLESNRTK